MSKPVAFGLIIFFLLVIVGGLVWLLFFSGQEGMPGVIDRFFPVAGERDRPLPGGSGDAGETPKITDETSRRLIKISEGRISGFHLVDGGVRYIERATGHVFESSPDGRNQARVSGTTIPGIFESVWAHDASAAVIKYREGQNVRLASVKFSGTTTDGVLLPVSVKSLDWAPDRKRLAYIAEVNGALAVISADQDNTKQSEVLRLPFADFEISWPTIKLMSFSTRPSGEADGFSFGYNADTKILSKLIGPEAGLEALWSGSGKNAVISTFDQSAMTPKLSRYEVSSGKTDDLQTLTLVGKCAWAPKSEKILYCAIPSDIPKAIYPDSWYKGEVGFDDALWNIDVDSLKKANLADLPDIDVEQIAVSSDESHVYFKDKKDGALWSYQLKE